MKFEPINKNLLESNNLLEEYSNITAFSGKRKLCKSKGLKGKEFRDCVKGLRQEDKSLSKEEKKEKRKERKEIYRKALVEGKVEKGKGGRKAVHAINKFNPATLAVRGAVLSIINANVVDIAHAMSLIKDEKGTHWAEIQMKWWMWGGDKDKLDKAVDKGKNKKPLFKKLVEKHLKKKHGFDGYSNAEGKGANTAGNIVAASAALMGTAAGVLALVPEPTATTKAAAAWLGVGGGAFGSMSPILKSYAKQKGADAQRLAAIPPVPTGEKNPDNIPVVAPTDKETLSKVSNEMNKNYDSDEEAIERAERRAEKIKAGTYTEADAKADAEADRKYIESSSKILGMNKTVFWSGVVLLGLGAAFVIYKMKGKGTSVATS